MQTLVTRDETQCVALQVDEPPAKIVRLFLFQAVDAIKVTCLKYDRPVITLQVTAGLTWDAPYSTMEQ